MTVLTIEGLGYADDNLLETVIPKITPKIHTILFRNTGIGIYDITEQMKAYAAWKQDTTKPVSPRSTAVFDFMRTHNDRLLCISQIDSNKDGKVTDKEIKDFKCFEPKGMYYFGKALSSTNVRALVFQNSFINNTIAIFLAHGLINGGKSKVSIINFSHSKSLSDDGAKVFLQVPSIERLMFADTYVSESCMHYIANELARIKSQRQRRYQSLRL